MHDSFKSLRFFSPHAAIVRAEFNQVSKNYPATCSYPSLGLQTEYGKQSTIQITCPSDCSDNHLAIDRLIQAYLRRWEIEVNFRDVKTILGCGQVQIRNKNAVYNLQAFTTAFYSIIHLGTVFFVV